MPPPQQLTVAQVLPTLDSGGVERGTLEVGKYLAEHGHRSIVISAGGRLVEQLRQEGSEHVQWDIGQKSLWTLRLVPRLRRFLRENQVDILHVRSRMPAWVCWLAWLGMAPGTRPRFLTTVHGFYSVNGYSAVMLKGESVIAVSEAARHYIVSNYPSCPTDRIEVIPRGVDPAAFPHGHKPTAAWLQTWRAAHPDLSGKRILTLPGRITRLKGHHDFIKLIGHLRQQGIDAHGLIVGPEDPKRQGYAEELRQTIRQKGLDKAVTFTGGRADIREIYAVSDLVLSLSSQPESFGRTVLEALSLGIPVAGYAHGGVGEILETLYPAGLIPPNDFTALAATASALLTQPPPVPPNHQYTLQNMLERTLALYESMAKSRTLTA